MNKTEKKASAKRKLIPAVAMFVTSAIMLSTSTYAWFTLNKEVKVTGLEMSATVSDGLEISLGAMGETLGALTPSIKAPNAKDLSWSRAIEFQDYYSIIGKLKPVSSDTGESVWKVADEKKYAGGKAVLPDAIVTGATKEDSATATLFTTGDKGISPGADATEIKTNEGYYIDIPVWIRSSVSADAEVLCSVYIDNGTNSAATSDPAKEAGTLKNAVRVAIIPMDIGTNSSEFTDTFTQIGSAGTYTDNIDTNKLEKVTDSSVTVFGLKNTTHTGSGVIAAEQIVTAGNTLVYGTPTAENTQAATFTKVKDYNSFQTAVGAKTDFVDNDLTKKPNAGKYYSVFKLEKSDANEYSGCGFMLRIWLEGESEDCWDATANQDWTISLYFTTDETMKSGYTPPNAG